MKKKIRVLTIHNRLHLGGPIFIIAYITKYLNSDLYETKLLLGPPLPDEVSADFFLQKENVVYTLVEEMTRKINPFNDLIAFWKIRKIIKEFKPDIVHTHTTKAGTLGRIAAWTCNVPITIHTFHGHVFHSYFSAPINLAIKLFEKTLATYTDKIVTISKEQRKDICNVYKITSPDKCPMIPLGLDLEKFHQENPSRRIEFRNKYKIQPGEITIGIIGRFAPIKNHLLLLQAIQLINQKSPQTFNSVVLFLIGDGELKNNFTRYLKENNIPSSHLERTFSSGGVIFTSWIKEVELALPGLDLVVLTSDNEGTPLSLIEAQAAGVAVLSTDVGGVKDVVKDKETGWLVPKNDPDSLCNKLIEIIQEPTSLKNTGMKGREWVMQEFSIQRLIKDTEKLYNQLLIIKGITQNNLKTEYQLPKISIITVSKNRLNTLKKTVESVENQDYKNIQYIVIDAQSTDGTIDFLQKTSRVDTFISEPDEGIYDAMNKGIKVATGDIIAFLNSDDFYIDSKVISNVVNTFSTTDADAVYGDIVYIDEKGEVKRYWKAGKYRTNSFKWGWMPPHPTFFVKKQVLIKHGLFLSNLSLSADYELMLRLIHFQGIFVQYLPKILVCMRLGGASNQTLTNRLKANKQDKLAWSNNQIKANAFTTILKPIRKMTQWIMPTYRIKLLERKR